MLCIITSIAADWGVANKSLVKYHMYVGPMVCVYLIQITIISSAFHLFYFLFTQKQNVTTFLHDTTTFLLLVSEVAAIRKAVVGPMRPRLVGGSNSIKATILSQITQ